VARVTPFYKMANPAPNAIIFSPALFS